MKPISEQTIINTRVVIGNKLKAFREAKGLTMQDVQDNTNIHKDYIKQIEAGHLNYAINMLLLYCIYLEFDLVQ